MVNSRVMGYREYQTKIPNLRVKRAHKKVRSGCLVCKQARVKCNEVRPRCGRCCRRGLECAWPSRSTNLPRDDATPVKVEDTELAKHYLSHTMHALAEISTNQEQSEAWRVLIPALAFTCPVVRRGMLTLSALCMHYDREEDGDDKYLETAEAHGKIFVKQSSQKIQDLQYAPDHNSILACSRLLCVLGFAWFRVRRQQGLQLADPASWNWLHLLRGVKIGYSAIVSAGKPVDEIFMRDMTPILQSPLTNSPIGGSDCLQFIQQSRAECFYVLRTALYQHWSSVEPGKIADLSLAIEILSNVYDQVCSGQMPNLLRAVSVWPAQIPKGFVEMLTSGFRPALIVYAHWLMLMALVEHLWFIDDMGREGIRQIIDICKTDGMESDDLMFWPQQTLDMWL